MESTSLLRDEPLAPGDEDLFRRGPLAGRLAQLVSAASSEDSSIVYAVVGAWGSGKTSLLNLMEVALDDGIRVVRFNPWLVGSVEDLLRDFFATLMEAIPDAVGWNHVREAIGAYGAVAAPILRLIPGASPLADAASLLTSLGDPKPLGRLRADAEEALRSAGGSFVVVIDDIDRLQPDELLLMLKLIRLVGRLPRVHYVLAFDEETLLAVLGSRSVAAGEARSIEYLEKIVQVRIDIPDLHRADLDELVSRGLDAALQAASVELDQDTLDRLRHRYGRFVRPGLHQPRQVARLLSQFQTVLPLLAGEVDVVDLFLLTYLRMRWPALYTQLPRWAEELPSTLAAAMRERTVSADERRAAWERRLENVIAEEAARVEASELMKELFPGFRSAFGRSGTSGSLVGDQRIGVGEYFHRYFQLGVPSDDVPDSVVRSAVADLLRDITDSSAVADVRAALRDRPRLVLDKLLAASTVSGTLRGSVSLAGVLLEFRPTAEQRSVDLLRPPEWLIDQWIALMATNWIHDGSGDNLRSAHLLAPPGLMVLVRGLHWLSKSGEAEEGPLADCVGVAMSATTEWLRTASEHPLESDELPRALAYLSEMGQEVSVRALVANVLDSSAWTTADFIGSFVSVGRSAAGESLGELHLDYLARTMSLEEVVARLSSEIDAATAGARSQRPEDVSLSARRSRALSELRRMRDDPGSLFAYDPSMPILRTGPSQTVAPLSAMDLSIRVALSLPEPVVTSPGTEVRWAGEPVESVLERQVEATSLSEFLATFSGGWGDEARRPRWSMQASSANHYAEAFFGDHDRIPQSGVASRVWLAVRGDPDDPSEVSAMELIADLGVNLKELNSDRRPAGMRHETTPPPIPAAFTIGELVQTIARFVSGVADLLRHLTLDLNPAADGQAAVWLSTSGGYLDRFVELSEVRRLPGAAHGSEYVSSTNWPLPRTLDTPEVALAKSLVANGLQRSGYRDFKDLMTST